MLVTWFWFCLPSHLFNDPTSYVVEDRDGNLLSASIAEDGQWRFPYTDTVPEKFIQCITTFEDKRFFYHPGIDPLALMRAIFQNIRSGSVVSGGSTITMQVIRMSRGAKRRNIFNKLIESVEALRLECTNRKNTILALYAGNAPFGGNVVGLDAAAWRYYGRNATALSWGEMAALTVLPNAPSLVRPGKNQHELLRKRNLLLDKLADEKIIDASIAELSKLEPLPGVPKPLPQLAPHLLDRFKKNIIAAKAAGINVTTGIHTTLQIDLQEQVNEILLRYHQQLEANQIHNAAAMVVDVETGNILSYTGNVYETQDSSLESHVDVLASKRSPGSTLKPLLYCSLLSEGSMLPQQLVPDIPTQINGYAPENFNLGYDGAVPANRALARSLNIPAVKMLQQYHYQRFYNVLQQCGFTTLNHPADFYGMSLILGGCEISPYELCGVYASMARMYLHQRKNKGLWNNDDWFMPKYNDENLFKQHATKPQSKLFDYTSMWLTFNAMNEVMRPGEEGLWNMFQSAQRIAWKTGTSFGFRDGWAVGFTPKYCVVVWVGNTTGEGRPGLTGIQAAAPIMFDIFRVLPTSKWFSPPQYDFMYLPVCHQSGFKAGDNCTDVDTMLVPARALQAPVCPYHKIIHLDKTGTYRVNSNCVSPSEMLHRSWFVLPPTMEYYYKQHHTDYATLPPFMAGCTFNMQSQLDIVYPQEGAQISIPKEFSGEKGRTVFTVQSRNNSIKLFWSIDDVYIGETENIHQMAVNPAPGKHTLTVVDENGDAETRNFEIVTSE
ncbi:MAG: penicillin-binding protein 1C [Bacteroidetes bacterium]|nr:penicillin-binding protein 1C [Bacteroidota bacterium]